MKKDGYAVCDYCGKKLLLETPELKDWQMQHMHFEDGERLFLTCDKCKTLNPMVMLEKLESEGG